MNGSLGLGARPASVFAPAQRYVRWFHDLDAWTEYWDVYHPESKGRYYFGDGDSEAGLLAMFLPRAGIPRPFATWKAMALYPGTDRREAFAGSVTEPGVAAAVREVDDLLARLFETHFGDAGDPSVRADYLEAMSLFATDRLPPATERDARILPDDPRKSTAGRHTLEGDIMWFCWALEIEAASLVDRRAERAAFHALQMAGVAAGCGTNFSWRGHRRTRSEYRGDEETVELLKARGRRWASDFDAATAEVHALFRIREWGDADGF